MRRLVLALALAVLVSAAAFGAEQAEEAEQAAPEAPAVEAGVLEARVVEATIFSTGSGIFTFEGKGTVKDGQLVVRDLPKPAFGTLWFWSMTDEVDVVGVRSKVTRAEYTKQIWNVWELLTRNKGKHARVIMTDGPKTPEGVPTDWEVEGKINFYGDGNLILETENGVLALELKATRSVHIEGAQTAVTATWDRKELAFDLEGEGAQDGQEVTLAWMFLQEGARWLPSYRMDLEDKKAALTLAATFINDAFDMTDARVSFVVGKPLFGLSQMASPVVTGNRNVDLAAFGRFQSANELFFDDKDWSKRIATNLEQQEKYAGRKIRWGQVSAGEVAIAGLPVTGRVFSANGQQSAGEYAFSLAATAAPIADVAVEAWHLFYYEADSVTAAKDTSARVVLWRDETPLKNLFIWSAPAAGIYQNPKYSEKLRKIYSGGIFRASKVEDKSKVKVRYTETAPPMHGIILDNKTGHAWASAPLMVYEDERALGQVWLAYTPDGQEARVVIGPANDVRTWQAEREVFRDIKAGEANGRTYDLITVEGYLKIANKRDGQSSFEIKKHVRGTPISYSDGCEVTVGKASGKILNPPTTLKWEIDIKPGKEHVLTYTYKAYVPH